jgi:hypothetical protein
LIDVLEMLKYLANMNSSISENNIINYGAYNAACITGDVPVIGDVLDMLKWLAGMDCILTEHWGKKS